MICCLSILKIHIDYREGYIDTSWHHTSRDLTRCISKFTGLAIIEERSIRRVRRFLISWGQKAPVKHCYVDLSS